MWFSSVFNIYLRECRDGPWDSEVEYIVIEPGLLLILLLRLDSIFIESNDERWWWWWWWAEEQERNKTNLIKPTVVYVSLIGYNIDTTQVIH